LLFELALGSALLFALAALLFGLDCYGVLLLFGEELVRALELLLMLVALLVLERPW